MMTTTCLIGEVVNGEASTVAVVTCLPVEAAWGDAPAAAAVSALATSPAAATALTRLISFSFIGLPSPSVRELSECRESPEDDLKSASAWAPGSSAAGTDGKQIPSVGLTAMTRNTQYQTLRPPESQL